MPILDAAGSALLLIDLQARLMPAIDGAEAVVRNTSRLARAARLLDVPVLRTEQNPAGLGRTVDELAGCGPVLAKTAFDASGDRGWVGLPGGRATAVVAGCEAHVCVLQTVLGLRAAGVPVAVVADAVGSRTPANRDAGLARMAGHGAELVTAEMVVFEWLGASDHPRFREVQGLVK